MFPLHVRRARVSRAELHAKGGRRTLAIMKEQRESRKDGETQSCCREKTASLSSSPGTLGRKAHKASLAALVSQMAILATEFLSSPALNLGQAFAWYNRPALEKSLAVFLRDSEH